MSRRDFDPVHRVPIYQLQKGWTVQAGDNPDVLTVTSVYVDPDLGALVEMRTPDGRLVYGVDPPLPSTEGQSTGD